MAQKDLLNPKKHPFFEHGEVAYFLAYQENKIVGRIAAIKNPSYNKHHNCNYGFFGFYDFIESKEVIDTLMTRYIESIIYQGVVENIACEMSARMIAMKSATDNAGDMIDKLKLVYNKARQASITQEISEIVSGAAAVE